jgi:DNA repair protein RadC
MTQMAEINVSYFPLNKSTSPVVSSNSAYEQVLDFFPKDTIALQEHFVVLYLNRANVPLGGFLCSSGGITGTVADIRIIMAVALKSLACAMIIAHNHPSGNLKPSMADIDLTKKIQSACKFMDINLVDHIIVSPSEGTYYSFADEGEL